MPAYAKCLKEILSKKRKVEETSVVKLTEHYSAILQNKLPQKCRDPGSFTIPCSLGRIVEDVLVRVDKFIFPVDFIVVNMEKNRAILDIQERQLMFKVGEERVIFKMKGAIGALKEQIGEIKTDKCGVYPKKDKKKL
ncbi:uncharacterized protein [Nicotiana tomentosiformis]|uniref:uncharacterized protein n=1 Tax=Nicotiana tomentosiformis TaxID=4098 RepID=UPI00388C8472